MNAKPKTVQVDYDLFLQMVAYIANHFDPYDGATQKIIDGIRAKLLAMERRDNFTINRMGSKAPNLEETMTEYQSLLSLLEMLS